MPNAILIPNIEKMLAEGHKVVMKVKGCSMLPFIRGDRDSVLLAPPQTAMIKPGAIALARIVTDQYVLHRIIHIDSTKQVVTLMGDGNLKGVERCSINDVLGIAVKVIHPNEKGYDLGSKNELRYARVWAKLLPIRRYLLAIYKRII